MADALGRVSERVAGLAAAAGFEPVEQRLTGAGPWWVQYRRVDSDDRILLEVGEDPAAGTVTAELWRPARLPELQHEIWPCWRTGDPQALAAAVAGVVAGWMQELAR
jgi:hypothetical protein